MKYVVLATLVAAYAVRQPTLELRVAGGRVRGSLAPGGRYHQFLSIPYAYTDRDNRFKAPKPVRPWDGVLDAVEENVRCTQRFDDSRIFGQDDCLTLNVYRPLTVDKPLPVMVWIHGGAFIFGSGQPVLYGPDYIVSKDVILVTINYRLSLQGFLCLGIEEAPGNAGMKDQVAALKWVQENIAAFGGDPDNVTIFGESAGGASVSFHIMSPMSKGLFHRAIIQSGSSLCSWALQMNPIYKASLLARSMGYNTTDPHELYNIFFEKSNYDNIVTRVPRPKGNICGSEILYTPCVEKEIPGVEPFLTKNPYDILVSGEYNKVPVMSGYTNEEGLFFVNLENDTSLHEIRFEKAMPKNLLFPNEEIKYEIANKFREIYMGDDEITRNTTAKLAKFYGEGFMDYPNIFETEIYAATSGLPVFAYKFAVDGKLNVPKYISNFSHVKGATHGDELFYLFKPRLFPNAIETLEKTIVEQVTTMWTNFAKYSDPTPSPSPLLPLRWPSLRDAPRDALLIAQPMRLTPLWHNEALILWNQTYTKYRRKTTPWS